LKVEKVKLKVFGQLLQLSIRPQFSTFNFHLSTVFFTKKPNRSFSLLKVVIRQIFTHDLL